MKHTIVKITLWCTKWQITAFLCRVAIKLLGQRTPTYVYVVAATTYRNHDQFNRSLKILERPLARSPKNHLLLEQTAESFMGLTNWPQAAKHWQLVIFSAGEQAKPHVWHKLARVFRLDGNFAAADLVVGKGLKLYPTHMGLWQEAARVATLLKDWPLAAERWQHFSDHHSEKDLESAVNLAAALRQGGQTGKAQKVLDANRKYHGEKIEFLIEEGEVANTGGNWPEALARWQKAAEVAASRRIPLSIERYIQLNISVTGRLADIKSYRTRIKQHQKAAAKRAKSKLRVAIYTSFAPVGYDSLKPHEYLDDRFDYFIYTDAPLNTMGIYQWAKIPPEGLGLDGARAIRYAKTHPHVLFKDYDVAVWLDTSIMLVGDIYPIIEKFLASGKAIGSTPHTVRQSLFEEFLACVALGKDDYQILQRLKKFYESEGFDSSKLAENGFLLFNPKHKDVAAPLEEWWQMILKFSKRDQLTFSYSLAKHDVEWFRISEPPNNLNNNPSFLIMPHNTDHVILDKLAQKLQNL
jgi:tetratricopeptide (TPR) repeat protein